MSDYTRSPSAQLAEHVAIDVNFPSDALWLVFFKLPLKDRAVASVVCKLFRKAFVEAQTQSEAWKTIPTDYTFHTHQMPGQGSDYVRDYKRQAAQFRGLWRYAPASVQLDIDVNLASRDMHTNAHTV